MSDEHHKDCHAIAAQNDQEVLRAIARFGGLTTRQLGRLVWAGQSAGMRMAQRTCARLLDRHWILRRRLPNGGAIYVLSQGGAAYLRRLGIPHVSARGHRDLKFQKPVHRLICNETAIDYTLEGARVWTEFEVQRGLAPFPEIVCNHRPKLPDGVAITAAGYVWLEVENSFKSQRRLRELAHVCEILLDGRPTGANIPFDGENGWDSMVFVSTNLGRLADVARAFDRAIDVEELEFEKTGYVYLRKASISPGFVWGGLSGHLSIMNFLQFMYKTLDFQRRLRELFSEPPPTPDPLGNEELADILSSVYEADEYPLEFLSKELGVKLDSYEVLRTALRATAEHFNRDNAIDWIQTARKVMTMNIGFNPDYLHYVFTDSPYAPPSSA